MAEKNATRQRILEAVVTCTEKYGVDKVTTRKIALEAGTNIASINYHFRSKDELMAEALSMTIHHMMEDVFASIDDTSVPFLAAFENVIFYLLDGSRTFPGMTRAHLYPAVVQRDESSISAKAMMRVFDRLCKRAVQGYAAKDAGMIRFTISEIMSSVLFSLLAPGFFPVPQAYQPSGSKSARSVARQYVRLFAAMLG